MTSATIVLPGPAHAGADGIAVETAAVVLAGTYSYAWPPELPPRPLVPVANVPLVLHVLTWLAAAGVQQATVCANGSTTAVESMLTSEFAALPRVDCYADVMPRGAAGCARDAALATVARAVLVVCGAAIPTANLPDVLAAHRDSGAAVTVVTEPEEDLHGAAPLAPAGIYVCAPHALDYVPRAGFHDLKEQLIPRLHEAGELVQIYPAHEAFPHVLDLDTYLAANQWMLERGLVSAADRRWRDYVRVGEAMVHRAARIHPTAAVVGPAVIGPGADIGKGCVVVGPTVVGAGSVLGPGSVLSRSVTWRRSAVGAGAIVDYCLLGERSRVAADARVTHSVRLAAGDE
jgi:NDP-sugar pyrophosphorylase family protein